MTTLARLSFWVPTGRTADFEKEYADALAPILTRHGLFEAAESERPIAVGVCSKLFEVEAPRDIAIKERALQSDPAWQEELARLGRVAAANGAESLPYQLHVYETPAGAGRTVEAGPGYRQGLWQSFGVQDGLPHPSVFGLLQDRDGALWFVSESGGACRYDGMQFTALTSEDGLASNYARAVFVDRRGDLWFGTERGASRYDGRTFVTFTAADGLGTDGVYAFAEDGRGHLWMGTERGPSRYDGRTFHTFTAVDDRPDKAVVCIAEDQSGNMWFGTAGDGVLRFDGRDFARFTAADGLAGDYISAIAVERSGRVWFGTAGEGVSCCDGTTFTSHTAEGKLLNTRVTSIVEDRSGHLWFGTNTTGAVHCDGRRFKTFGTENGLANDQVMCALEDREGCLWFGTWGGLSRYDGVRFANFTTADGLANNGVMTAYERRVEYQDLPLGQYTFQVRAVDQDLNYSDPAAISLSVVPDPRLEALTEALSGTADEFVGESQALRQAQAQLAEVARTDLTVLILGETGTGKGLAARTLHGLSQRKAGPFIPVNCGTLPANLVESELFGHEKGAFTGAVARKLGKVEVAEGGTLFLDEIGDMAPDAQVKLLQFLEEGTFERVGGTRILEADVRVIAATNRDLQQMIEAGSFREDLYFRLRVFPLELPPLRRRREDIPVLATYFASRMAAHLHKEVRELTPAALEALTAYDWPGNVRELEHEMQRAVVVCREPVIRAEDIALGGVPRELGREETELRTLEEVERRHILAVLEKTGWVIKGPSGAAAILGLPPSTLRGRMRKLGIERS